MNFFQWLAGADKDILEKCSEDAKIKITGYGTLVLIPAVVGFFSMAYAISTLTNSIFVYILCGLIWFLIIGAVDRFIVSTLHKSTLNNNGNFGLALATRVVFAIIVGISVSHPVVMLWFNDGIGEKITLEKIGDVNRIDSLYNIKLDNARIRLDSLKSMKDCYVTLKTAEQSGQKVALPCGYSSGIPGSNKRTDNIQQIIDDLNNEIDTEKPIFDIEKVNLEEQRKNEKSIIEKSKSYDYLSRVRKLSELENDPISGNHIFWVKIFIMLFFVFLDVLPVTMKASTSYGDYEAERDKMLFAKIEKLNIEKEIISTFGRTANLENAKARVQHEQKMNELNDITKSTNDFLKSQEKQRTVYDIDFQKQLNNLNEIKDNNLKNDRIELLNEDREIFKKASKISQVKFLDYLKSL